MRYLIIFFIFQINFLFGQRVYPKTAIIRLENFSTINSDGLITFEIDVRMADCLSHIEMNDFDRIKKEKNFGDKLHDWWWFKVRKIYDFEVSKTFIGELNEQNYYLKVLDVEEEHISMKCDLIQLKSVFSRKTIKKKIEINLYSKSGKKVYSKVFILDKNKLLEKMEVRLGVEPS